VLREEDDDPSLGREPGRLASELPADLQRIVERLWRQHQYQGAGKLSALRDTYRSTVSKERAADWLREKVGQRVFSVAPWLNRAAGASMRIARLCRRVWTSGHGYCERPRCTDEELEAVMGFLAARDEPPERAP
jgi:hypothetical protein